MSTTTTTTNTTTITPAQSNHVDLVEKGRERVFHKVFHVFLRYLGSRSSHTQVRLVSSSVASHPIPAIPSHFSRPSIQTSLCELRLCFVFLHHPHTPPPARSLARQLATCVCSPVKSDDVPARGTTAEQQLFRAATCSSPAERCVLGQDGRRGAVSLSRTKRSEAAR